MPILTLFRNRHIPTSQPYVTRTLISVGSNRAAHRNNSRIFCATYDPQAWIDACNNIIDFGGMRQSHYPICETYHL